MNDNLQTKFIEFKSILFSKKGEIDMIRLTLPDGSVREIEAAQSSAEIIKNIGSDIRIINL